jgi:hypothetical protein
VVAGVVEVKQVVVLVVVVVEQVDTELVHH